MMGDQDIVARSFLKECPENRLKTGCDGAMQESIKRNKTAPPERHHLGMFTNEVFPQFFAGGNKAQSRRLRFKSPVRMAHERYLMPPCDQATTKGEKWMQVAARSPGGQQPAFGGTLHGQGATGCCCVMQWKAPRPQIRSSAGQRTTRRVGKSVCRMSRALMSFG